MKNAKVIQNLSMNYNSINYYIIGLNLNFIRMKMISG